MQRLSIRWLLLGVAGASLLVPLIALFSLKKFDAVLVRQTERELHAQAALVAASYQAIWTTLRAEPMGNPRQRDHFAHSFTPWSPRLHDLDEVAAPLPEPLPRKTIDPDSEQAHPRWTELSLVLKNAQVFNLSGVRVLDEDGCALASPRAQVGYCFGELPEVRQALNGSASSVLRKRSSDEPTPTLTSMRRRGELRVFVSLPVYNEGQVIGAVWLSRTAESGLEWLFKQRRDLFYGALLALLLAVAVSLGFSRLITRPLARMKAPLNSAKAESVRLSAINAPAEIHTLAVALDERSDQLAKKSRYVTEFAANVSHELKTPLTSIRGAVELLQGAEMDDAQRARFLNNIDAAAERTERLVTRLLQLARLEARDASAKEENVALDSWLGALQLRYGNALEITSSVEPSKAYPQSALESVVGNLVDNALRYRQNEPVQLSFEEVETKSAAGASTQLHISVEDDGVGIREEDKKRLFERFFTTERDRGGTGLGLAIVLATAERRGGRVSLSSDPSGTRVEVWM